MTLRCLNMTNFLRPEAALISKFGIGAVGVITPNQTINVMNSEDGMGTHDIAKSVVLNSIYDFKNASENDIDGVLDSVVTLKYLNQRLFDKSMRYVIIDIPKHINLYQYETLKCLSDEFDRINNVCTFKVLVNLDGIDYESDEENNYLKLTLPEIKSRITYFDSAPEKLVTIDEYNRLTVEDCTLKTR